MNKRSLMLPAAVVAVLLTMMSLTQVFVEQKWFAPSILAVAVAFGAGWASRRLDVPGVLAPAVSLLAMLTLLGILFLRDTTAGGLPTAETMRALGEALSTAGRDIQETAPPAEATDALTLLATAGVFVVALIVDALVFWVRKPVAAGLPLLTLFLIPASIAAKPNVVAFVLAAAGYLGLLVAEGRDRARSWGRRLSGLDLVDDVADVSHVARVGRRIGSAAVGIALCVPIAVPSVGKGILTGNNGVFGRGSGSSVLTVINPIVQIKGRLNDNAVRPLLTVRTNAPEYLRLATLDKFDGTEWSLEVRRVKPDHRVRNREIPMPRELEDIPTTLQRYDVDVGTLAVAWLPIPYAPARVDVRGDWRYEDYGLSVFSTNVSSAGVSFVAQSRIAQPTADQLRERGEIPERIRSEYTRVPRGTPPLAMDIMNELTADKDTPYDKAVALNDYFIRTGGFVYNTEVPPGNGTDAVTAFLENKQGYCEQFAATMAYLARLAGIPARVIVGFTPGQRMTDGSYVVTNKDAHAWPELYFPSAGWVRFEPTPRGGTVQPGHLPVPNTGGGTPSPGNPTASPTANPTSTATAAPATPERENPGLEDPLANPGATDSNRGISVTMLVVVALAAVLVTPSLVAFGTRRRRSRRAGDHVGRIHAAWRSLSDAAEDAGYPLRAADSPRGAARRLVAAASLAGPEAAEVERLATAEERARYARDVAPFDGLDAGVRSVRKVMIGALPWRARVRATAFPASAMRRIVEGVRRLADTVDRLRDGMRAKALDLVRRRRTRAA